LEEGIQGSFPPRGKGRPPWFLKALSFVLFYQKSIPGEEMKIKLRIISRFYLKYGLP
jgi:hypothetical protein